VRGATTAVTIVERAPVAIGVLDNSWRLQQVNQSWSELLGHANDAASRRTLLDLIHPDDRPARQERLMALASGVIGRYHRETRLLRGDGGVCWGDLLIAPIHAPGGVGSQYIALIVDISERKLAEIQTAQQQQALAVIREREQLTHELHEGVGQLLSFVNLQAQTVRQLLARGDGATASLALDRLFDALDKAQTALQRLSSPPSSRVSLSGRPLLSQPAQPRAMRLLLVDDHQLFLEGLQNLLASYGVPLVGTARNGQEALEQARLLGPDMILMDLEMPVMDGIEAMRRILAELPATRVIILTADASEGRLIEALRSGASGYLLKSMSTAQFLESLEAVTRGELPLTPDLVVPVLRALAWPDPLAPRPPRVATEDAGQLTPRQLEVLTMVARAMTYKEVGAALALSERTVRYHMEEILKRLRMSSRREAIAFMTRLQRPE
jgi:two-component system NarL family response regulator